MPELPDSLLVKTSNPYAQLSATPCGYNWDTARILKNRP